MPRDIGDSHSGLILTKKDRNSVGGTATEQATLVERVEKRVAYEVTCYDLGPQPQYLQTTARTVLEPQGAYADSMPVGRVTIEQKRASADRNAESSSQVSLPSESVINMSMLHMLPKATRNEHDDRTTTQVLDTLKTSQDVSPGKSPHP